MASECQGKSSWPELLGKNGEEAAKQIEKENKNVDAKVILEGTAVTKDFRCDRVWVWVNNYGTVTEVPRVGKNSWPELVGVNGKEAEKQIEKENDNVDAIVVLEGTPVPEDFRCTRVWVWVNDSGIVTQLP
ncbi:Proteinase inhibitor [Morus notabilis]|uniref:Proteinase inhibitor n=2 Tax=Morus notabilis TaxID=981085 RepID=W9RJZ5_9ROSA|nr:Proteinase inhibitor [Morus notabilis]